MYSNNYDNILEFVEQYDAVSIEIVKNLFYNTKYGYDSSRRALSRLVKEGYLKTSKDFVSDKNIYYKNKPISSHKLMLLRLYSNIIAVGGKVLEFKKEYKANNIISDGLIVYKWLGEIKIILVEIDINNKTKEDRYIKLYEDGYYQELLGCFPRVFIIDKRAEKRKEKMKDYSVKFIYLDYEFSELEKYL